MTRTSKLAIVKKALNCGKQKKTNCPHTYLHRTAQNQPPNRVIQFLPLRRGILL